MGPDLGHDQGGRAVYGLPTFGGGGGEGGRGVPTQQQPARLVASVSSLSKSKPTMVCGRTATLVYAATTGPSRTRKASRSRNTRDKDKDLGLMRTTSSRYILLR